MIKYLAYLFLINSIIIIKVPFIKNSATNSTISKSNDSTIKQKFIVSLLNEYEQEGRWIFLKMERCKNQSAYEIVKPISLFKALAESRTVLSKERFVSNAFDNLNSHDAFFDCPEESKIYNPKATYSIEGIKVNMKKYMILKRLPIEKILSIYFDSKKFLKKQYRKNLTEIIAICYTNNVKVITNKSTAYYEIFE